MVSGIEEKIKEDFLLAGLTTIGLGGRADYFVECESVEEVVEALDFARDKDVPVHVLGGGSNTIFADGGFSGLVVKVANKGIEFVPDGDNCLVIAAAGEQWDKLVEKCVERGAAGFESMSGIPGLVGGAPVQNIGAYGEDVSDLVIRVETVDRRSGQIKEFTKEDCQFDYRSSLFKSLSPNPYVITEVVFRARKGEAKKIVYPDLVEELGGEDAVEELDGSVASLRKVREAVLAVRRRKGMVAGDEGAPKSCGSYFVNPVVSGEELREVEEKSGLRVSHFEEEGSYKIPAAWLIEQAGFPKGFRYDGVGVSPYHNLSLINYDGSTESLLELAGMIKAAVKDKFGIELEEEARIVG